MYVAPTSSIKSFSNLPNPASGQPAGFANFALRCMPRLVAAIRVQRVAATLFFMILLLTLAGCQTPSAKWAVARDTLTVATQGATTAAKLGKLSDKQILAADVIIQAARAGLRQAETLLPQGGKAFDSYLAIVETAVIKLAEYQALTHKPPKD